MSLKPAAPRAEQDRFLETVGAGAAPAGRRRATRAGRRRRMGRSLVVLGVLGLLVATGTEGWLIARLRDESRALRETSAGLATDLRRTEEELGRAQRGIMGHSARLGSLGEQIGDVRRELPTDLPGLLEEVQDAIVTVEAGPYQGTGFAIYGDVLGRATTAILTNEHVVREATAPGGPKVFVRQGDRRFRATLRGWDVDRDLALLLVDRWLPRLQWASDRGHRAAVGEAVIAIGSPYGIEQTVTTGVISTFHRGFIQTDAAVNPGNSGGPLLNRFGEVVGVVSYRLSEAQNINFAVPVEDACKVVLDC